MCSPSSSSPNVYDPHECEEGVFLYRVEEVGLHVILGKYPMQPPPCALNAPPKQGGVGRSWGWCARVPWANPLATTLLWWVAGWA
jgi:hypothetical protein